MTLKKSRCKNPDCNKAVYFMTDEKGKIQILDATAPVFHFNGEDALGARCYRLQGAYVSHFSTCKSPGAFSKKGKK
jgi:hypothetical protein